MKYANLLKFVDTQISKGNTILMSDYSIVSEEYLSEQLKKAFIKGLRNGSVEPSCSLEEFKKNPPITFEKLEDIRTCLLRVFDTKEIDKTVNEKSEKSDTEKKGGAKNVKDK